jgi:hypothetical protein
MAIRISDNLMNKPMLPGGGSDGTENVTRQFGNRNEVMAGGLRVPNGYGGATNPEAGKENVAAAKAVQSVANSVVNLVDYVDNIKMADEDGRQKSMFYRVSAKSEELRRTLAADPELSAQSQAVQQARYEQGRDRIVDEEIQKEQFSHPKVIQHVENAATAFRTTDSTDYVQKHLVPQMVMQRKARDGEDVATIIGKAQVAQTPEAAAEAAARIQSTYRTPDAYATYTAVTAQLLERQALNNLQKGIVDSASMTADDAFANAPKTLGITGLITKEALNEGPIAAMISDQTGKLDAILVQAGANEQERFVARETYQKRAIMQARNAISSHNEAFKIAEREQKEAEDAAVIQTGNKLFAIATNGGASDTVIQKHINSTLSSLGIDPVAAVEGKLTDPRQIRLADKVLTEGLKARGEQNRFRREQVRDARDIETLRLQREQMIMPSTQKGSDMSFKDFQKGAGLGDKPAIAYTPDEWNQVNAFLAKTSPTHLPKSIDNSITWGLNSGDPAAVKAGLTAFTNLERNNPALAAQVDTRTREIAERLKTGQSIERALAEVNNDALRSPEQKAAIKQKATMTIEQWRRGNVHPVAQAMGVTDVAPAVVAFANREYTDAIGRGESPEVAKKTMLAKVQGYAGKTKLMSGNGSEQLVVNAPEVRFNVGKEQGPGLFGRMLGARENPNAVTNTALTEDIKDTLKKNGIPEDSKYFLGQPIERGGKPFYPIFLLKDGAAAGPAMDPTGSPILWTFDPNDNPVMNKQRLNVAEHDKKVEAAKVEAAIEARFKTLVFEGARNRNTPSAPGKRSYDEAALRAQARKEITGK